MELLDIRIILARGDIVDFKKWCEDADLSLIQKAVIEAGRKDMIAIWKYGNDFIASHPERASSRWRNRRSTSAARTKPKKRGLYLTKEEHEMLLHFLSGVTDPESGMMGGNPEFAPVWERIKKLFEH